MEFRIHPLLLALLALISSGPLLAVEDSALAKYWTSDAQRIPYRAIVTPGREHDEQLPLIVFLHGDWQDGTDNQSQLAGYGNGSMELIDTALRNRVPLVYVAPQTTGAYWPPARVAAVVADVLRKFPMIDPRRVVLTGISDGATGVFDAIKTAPACYAAGVPMSGMTEISGLAPIQFVPLWAFHGAKDNDTDVEAGYDGEMVGSRAVVRALRAIGAKPRYTEYPEGDHVIWHEAYATDGLLAWMLSQRLRGRPCDFSSLGSR